MEFIFVAYHLVMFRTKYDLSTPDPQKKLFSVNYRVKISEAEYYAKNTNKAFTPLLYKFMLLDTGIYINTKIFLYQRLRLGPNVKLLLKSSFVCRILILARYGRYTFSKISLYLASQYY